MSFAFQAPFRFPVDYQFGLLTEWEGYHIIGYPDFATRMFVLTVCESQRKCGKGLPVFLLTDADPHGLNIALCYIRNLSQCNVQWIGVRPSDDGQHFHVKNSSLLPLTMRENTLLQNMVELLSRQAATGQQTNFPLLHELQVLSTTQVKFEMEALAAEGFRTGQHSLLTYLMARMCDEGFEHSDTEYPRP